MPIVKLAAAVEYPSGLVLFSNNSIGSVMGGSKGSPFRDIFVYRVGKEVTTDDLYS